MRTKPNTSANQATPPVEVKARVKKDLLAAMLLHDLVIAALQNTPQHFFENAAAKLDSAADLAQHHPGLGPEVEAIKQIVSGLDGLKDFMFYASGDADLG
jgi:hypothetical protein